MDVLAKGVDEREEIGTGLAILARSAEGGDFPGAVGLGRGEEEKELSDSGGVNGRTAGDGIAAHAKELVANGGFADDRDLEHPTLAGGKRDRAGVALGHAVRPGVVDAAVYG